MISGRAILSYLRSFPVDKIKIDRSFVADLDKKADCAIIVRAVASLGISLGIATTAEGVETAEEFELLRADGCTEVQGYLFSPPKPIAETLRLLGARPQIFTPDRNFTIEHKGRLNPDKIPQWRGPIPQLLRWAQRLSVLPADEDLTFDPAATSASTGGVALFYHRCAHKWSEQAESPGSASLSAKWCCLV